MNTKTIVLPLALFGLAVAVLAAADVVSGSAQTNGAKSDAVAVVSDAQLAAVAAHIPGAKVTDLRATPLNGVFEYSQGADIVYVTADGRYGISGDLYRIADKENLTEIHRRELRLALINAVPESSMLVFAPATPAKYTITVFTDVDCTYCRALHKQIAEYNRLGMKVRYMFFPRTGPNTESWTKAEQVWCSADRHSALTHAKLGEALTAPPTCANPVAQGYQLGHAIGLSGTPGIVTERGDLLPGYAPPDEMLEQLKREAEPAKG